MAQRWNVDFTGFPHVIELGDDSKGPPSAFSSDGVSFDFSRGRLHRGPRIATFDIAGHKASLTMRIDGPWVVYELAIDGTSRGSWAVEPFGTHMSAWVFVRPGGVLPERAPNQETQGGTELWYPGSRKTSRLPRLADRPVDPAPGDQPSADPRSIAVSIAADPNIGGALMSPGSPDAPAPGAPPTVAWAATATSADLDLSGAPGWVLASVARRFVAWVVDWLIVLIFVTVGGALFALVANNVLPAEPFDRQNLLARVTLLADGLFLAVYFTRCWLGPRHATLGQRWLKVRVGNVADGRPLTANQAVRRWVVLGYPLLLLDGLLPWQVDLPFIAALVLWPVLFATTAASRSRQGLHDRVAGSAVFQPAGLGSRFVAVGVGLALVVSAPIAWVSLADSGILGPASVETITFGTGGSGCSLATAASSFPTGRPVRVVAEFSPDLPTGATVTISALQDGSARPDLGATITMDAPASCVNGTVGGELPLAAGHYRLEMRPSTEGSVVGDFEVTQP